MNLPPPCDREVYQRGEPVAILDAASNDAEQFVKAIARLASAKVDWHYSGGRAQVLFLGDADARTRVEAALDTLEPTLKGTILKRITDGIGLYRRVVDAPKQEGTGQMPQKPVPIVYIAGKFTASHAWGIEQNVRAAEMAAVPVVRAGAMPLIPHANTRFFHGLPETTEEFWYAGTLELLRRCDAIYLVPGWEESRGVNSEVSEARDVLHIPIFNGPADLDKLDAWVKEWK